MEYSSSQSQQNMQQYQQTEGIAQTGNEQQPYENNRNFTMFQMPMNLAPRIPPLPLEDPPQPPPSYKAQKLDTIPPFHNYSSATLNYTYQPPYQYVPKQYSYLDPGQDTLAQKPSGFQYSKFEEKGSKNSKFFQQYIMPQNPIIQSPYVSIENDLHLLGKRMHPPWKPLVTSQPVEKALKLNDGEKLIVTSKGEGEEKTRSKEQCVTEMLREYTKLFPSKAISAILREYAQRSRFEIDFICNDPESNQGYTTIIMIDGMENEIGKAKSKKESREVAAFNVLVKKCLVDPQLSTTLLSAIHKQKNIQNKFSKQQGQKDQQAEEAKQLANAAYINGAPFDSKFNYRDKISCLVQSQYKVAVSYQVIERVPGWEALCLLGKLETTGTGPAKKEAKNQAAYYMLKLLETSNKKEVRLLTKKAIVNSKIKENNRKLKELAELKAQKIRDGISEQEQLLAEKRAEEQREIEREELEAKQALLNSYSCVIDENYEDQAFLESKQRSKLSLVNSILQSYRNKQAMNDEAIYVGLRDMFEVFCQNRSSFTSIGAVDFAVVGSHEFRILRKSNLSIDVMLSFDSTVAKCSDAEFRSQVLSIALQLFPTESTNMTFLPTSEVNKFFLQIVKEPNNLTLRMYFEDVSELGYHGTAIHHAIWLSQMKSRIISNPEVQTVLRFLRHWRLQFKIEIGIELIDFLVYAVTNKFQGVQQARALIDFFEFIVEDGVKDILNDNRRQVDVPYMYYDLLANLPHSQLEHLKQTCRLIYHTGNYDALKIF